MNKMWAGRTAGAVDHLADDFNSSISFDCRMYRQDIRGSMAHASMLLAQGILQEEEYDQITAGLEGILHDLESGALAFDPAAEDIHMFVESVLTGRIGAAGKKLHTARSRNDQVALDLRLCLLDESTGIRSQIRELAETICTLAEQNADTIMPGYTHMQRGQPITMGQQLLAYANMLLRDMGRLDDCKARMAQNPLGSCALAGTTFPIDRFKTTDLLGLSAPCMNSIDGVSDRDFVLELASCLSVLMMHLSRLSEELILWCSWEFHFAELSDAYSTGSSIMPQKKNPDMAELIRGKTGRVYGDLMGLLTVMKGLPLAYNKDMQEDKEAIFDCLDTVKMCLPVMTGMLKTIRFLPENMKNAAKGGFINATDVADYLARKGLPFRDAYKASGQMVAFCLKCGKTLEDLTLAELNGFSPLFGEDYYAEISLETCVSRRNSYGGTSPDSVRAQVEVLQKLLAK